MQFKGFVGTKLNIYNFEYDTSHAFLAQKVPLLDMF